MAFDPYALPEGLPVPEDDGAADHLTGAAIPSLELASSSGPVDLTDLCAERGVVYVYPRTGRPGRPTAPGWDEIPGARGCTPQSCGFRDHAGELAELGARVAGVSAQSLDDQIEFAERNRMPFPVIADPNLRLHDTLRLPTFDVEGARLYKRLAWIAEGGRIVKVFYPVFPPDRNATDAALARGARVGRVGGTRCHEQSGERDGERPGNVLLRLGVRGFGVPASGCLRRISSMGRRRPNVAAITRVAVAVVATGLTVSCAGPPHEAPPPAAAHAPSATPSAASVGVTCPHDPTASRPWKNGNLIEAQGRATGGSLWTLFYSPLDAFPSKQTVKIIWSATGDGDLAVQAVDASGRVVEPLQLEEIGGSNWHRPGTEWGTGWRLPHTGCWDFHVTRGMLDGDVWIRAV